MPDSFAHALVATADRPAIDVAVARRQHDVYRRHLHDAGVTVHLLPPDPAFPDCPFVEDAAVVLAGRALLARPGAESRRGEVDAVAAALADRVDVASRLAEPATLDGGDVLDVGSTLYVGRSARTNDAGITALRDFAAPAGYDVVPVDFTGALHLKSVVNRLDHTAVVIAAGHVAGEPFAGLRTVPAVPGEVGAANVLALGEGRVLVSDAAPDTAERIAAAGFVALPVDIGEFAKADGGLTCLSLRW